MSTATDLLRGLVLFILVPLAFAFAAIAWKLVRAYLSDRRSEYSRNRARSPSLVAVVRGEAPTFYDGVRDERVAAGVAVDIKANRWVEQGKLSEEAVSSVLR
jgi:hypothetical protein